MFATIDAAVSSVERQLRKNKARLEKRLRQDAFSRSVDVEEMSSFAPEGEEEEEFRIVRTKRFPIKLMTVEEAVLQMNLVDHTFFAFKNASHLLRLQERRRRRLLRRGLQAQRRRLWPH